MNSVMSSKITIAYLLMVLKMVTKLLLLWSIETILSVFDYLIQQASSELNYPGPGRAFSSCLPTGTEDCAFPVVLSG